MMHVKIKEFGKSGGEPEKNKEDRKSPEMDLQIGTLAPPNKPS